ncbi:MAG: hypothetical protein H7Z13_17020 [Ferruginibacter sp.]|nr:hypothetical protein [Ferruginibacter sp.]
MMGKTKIALSASEQELVCNKEWILTKLIIIEKVYRLFGMLALSMEQYIEQNKAILPVQAGQINPKISRGENYRGLPYVMMDYPRHFTKESTLAIRTLFWWGNFFSIHLQLSGACKEKAMATLKANFVCLQQKGYSLCVHAGPWEHHFEPDNYLPLENYTARDFATILHREPFIKIAKRISLQQWDAAPGFLEQHFYELVTLLQTNFPNDERGPSPGIPIAGFDL